MYVFEEMIEGKKLTEIINTTHENVKYLPGHKLPENVVSIHDKVVREIINLPKIICIDKEILRKSNFCKRPHDDLENMPI